MPGLDRRCGLTVTVFGPGFGPDRTVRRTVLHRLAIGASLLRGDRGAFPTPQGSPSWGRCQDLPQAHACPKTEKSEPDLGSLNVASRECPYPQGESVWRGGFMGLAGVWCPGLVTSNTPYCTNRSDSTKRTGCGSPTASAARDRMPHSPIPTLTPAPKDPR